MFENIKTKNTATGAIFTGSLKLIILNGWKKTLHIQNISVQAELMYDNFFYFILNHTSTAGKFP